MKRAELTGLTSIRFFGAIMVILYHISDRWPAIQWARPLLDGAPAGLTMFFMLSGFILTYNYLPSPFTVREFWSARAARILPLYLSALVFAIPQARFFAAASGVSLIPNGIPTLFLVQAWIPQCAIVWNGPGWSLSAEVFFYVLFPFILPLAVALFRRNFLATFLTLWLLGTLPILLYALLQPEGHVTPYTRTVLINFFKYNPLLRFPEFLMGIGLGTLYLDGWRFKRPRLTLTLGIVTLFITFILCYHIPYPATHNAFYAPLVALVVLALASKPDMMSQPWLELLGNCSYSIYLLHLPLFFFWNRMIAAHIPHGLSNVTYLVAITVLSVLSYKFIEVRGRKLLRKWLRGAPRPAPSATATERVPA